MTAVQPLGCPVVLRGPDGVEWSIEPWLAPEPPRPFEPPAALNRSDRRRAVRAQRKRGRS